LTDKLQDHIAIIRKHVCRDYQQMYREPAVEEF